MSIKDMKLYNLGEVIQHMTFGQVAVLVDGSTGTPYSEIGTTIYFDKDDHGALKFLHNGKDVVVCIVENSFEQEQWIIVDR